MSNKHEKDDAEKAEREDDEEDRDEKAQKSGKSEEGYIKDDAEKAEAHDEEEDADYDRGRGETEDAADDDAEAEHDMGQEQQGNEEGGANPLDEERKEALAMMDARYALRKEHQDLVARMDALEAKFGQMNTTPEAANKYTVSLDDELSSENK